MCRTGIQVYERAEGSRAFKSTGREGPFFRGCASVLSRRNLALVMHSGAVSFDGDTAMRTGRPKAQLEPFVRSRSLPAALALRARIILRSADGEGNKRIAAQLKLHKAAVGKWRRSFVDPRIAGLYDGVRRGAHDDLRGREESMPGVGAHAANVAHGVRLRWMASRTTTSVMALRRYLLRSTHSTGRCLLGRAGTCTSIPTYSSSVLPTPAFATGSGHL